MKLSCLSLVLAAFWCASAHASADPQSDKPILQLAKASNLRAQLDIPVDVPTSPAPSNATDTSPTQSLLGTASKLHVEPEAEKILAEFAEPLFRFEELNLESCNSQIAEWAQARFNEILEELGPEAIEIIQDYRILDMAWLYKYVIDQNERGEFFGFRGRYSREMRNRNEMIERFWESTDDDNSLMTDNILLLGMHGSHLRSKRNMRNVLRLLYGNQLSNSELNQLDRDLRRFIGRLPGGFNNPLLTANALAFDGEEVTEVLSDGNIYPDAIVMGDGIFTFLESLGLDEDGPDFVLAHEFGHQMQFETNIDELDENGHPRQFELMADAFGSYFMAHPNGGGVCIERIMEIQEAAFSVGDCDPDGSHGTPRQRECVTLWAASLALEDAQSNEALSPLEIRALFLDDLDDILAMDEEVCSFEVPANMEPVPCKN